MTGELQRAYQAELAAAVAARAANDHERAFHHFERAHILGQRSTVRHVHVHWLMLGLGVEMGDRKEILGQATRIVAAALFSRIWVPVGNTGRANVSALKPMPVPEDLRHLLTR